MTDEEIYKKWKSLTPDLRYLRPKRWEQIKEVIQSNNLNSIIEFGSGISTILFDNLGLHIVSYETSGKFISFVKPLCSPKVKFIKWNNRGLYITKRYDLALIDGILPRIPQLEAISGHSRFYAIDDFDRCIARESLPFIKPLKRVDNQSTILAIFEDTLYARG